MTAITFHHDEEPHASSTSFNNSSARNVNPEIPKELLSLDVDDSNRQKHEIGLAENLLKQDNFFSAAITLSRSVSPAASSVSDIVISIEPLSLRVTIIDEAERKVNYYIARKEVRVLERAVAQGKFKELDALSELIKTQAALADKRLFEADKDIGRAKVELTDVRKKATSEMGEMHDEVLFMARGPETFNTGQATTSAV